MSGLMGAFFVEVALVTYRAVTQGGVKTRQGKQSTTPLPAPLPSLYTSVILVYGGLGILPKSLAPVPALVGWGFVVATFLNLFTPGSHNAATQSNAALGTGLGTNPLAPTPAAKGGASSKP